jgi:hypothetical protein
MFPGSSKKIYDALYIRTRGAIKPCRQIRATKKDIADWSGIKNRKTIDGHLRYLETCGLLERRWELGNVAGYLFEVRLPEETPLVDRGGQRDRPLEWSDQNLVRGTDQKRDSDGQSQTSENKEESLGPKTFIKTERSDDDDEAFAGMFAALKDAITRVTGKSPTAGDAPRLKEIGELLAAELQIAASRTTVTSGPAFLAEHLRRRLRKADAKQIEREVSEASREAASAGPARPELSAEQLQEQVNLMVRLMRDGATIEELDEQFSGNFRPVQWHMIRGMALTQLGVGNR